MKRPAGIRENGARVVSLLMLSPDTAAGIASRLQRERVTAGVVGNVRHWLETLHNFGVVYVIGMQATRSLSARVYAMQPMPFYHFDNLQKTYRARNDSMPSHRNPRGNHVRHTTRAKASRLANCEPALVAVSLAE